MKPFFFFLCFLFLFGCEKATKYNSSPRDNFEALWRIMDESLQPHKRVCSIESKLFFYLSDVPIFVSLSK